MTAVRIMKLDLRPHAPLVLPEPARLSAANSRKPRKPLKPSPPAFPRGGGGPNATCPKAEPDRFAGDGTDSAKEISNGLQGCGRRRHRQCGPRNAEHSCGTPVSGGRVPSPSPRAVRWASEVSFGDKTLSCRDLEQFDFSQVDFCLMSAGSAVSKEWSPKIGATGCIVIDNSSCWRYDQDVPLVVPEVNAHVLEQYMAQQQPQATSSPIRIAPPHSSWWC